MTLHSFDIWFYLVSLKVLNRVGIFIIQFWYLTANNFCQVKCKVTVWDKSLSADLSPNLCCYSPSVLAPFSSLFINISSCSLASTFHLEGQFYHSCFTSQSWQRLLIRKYFQPFIFNLTSWRLPNYFEPVFEIRPDLTLHENC